MKTALIAVDVHRDSVEKNDPLVHRLTLVAQESDLVIVTRDFDGGSLHPKIRNLANYTIALDEEDYSAFAGETLRPKSNLEDILRKQGIQRVLVGGLYLNERIRFTALDSSALGYLTIVMLDCCTRSRDPEGEIRALSAFNRAGVLVQTMSGWSER